MEKDTVARLQSALWIVIFFGTGVSIALAVSVPMIENGWSLFAAMTAGASSGGYGAWLVFYIVLNLLPLSRGEEAPVTDRVADLSSTDAADGPSNRLFRRMGIASLSVFFTAFATVMASGLFLPANRVFAAMGLLAVLLMVASAGTFVASIVLRDMTHSRWQYSLRGLLIAMTLIAAALGFLVALI
jgi:hypothetical protein